MNTAASSIEKQVKAYCALIGADPLFVQGAGGNVSWKDGSVLWVKASGTWLAEAQSKEIFVPVNLTHLQDALAKQDFSVKPEMASGSGLRPSIETLLHALMPHRVVVHLHAVEILAHLVRVDAKHQIEKLVGDAVRWIFVDYFKPGAELARAVFEGLKNRPDADVVFMGNHGVVVGGVDVNGVSTRLHALILKLKTEVPPSRPETRRLTLNSELCSRGYYPCADMELSLLATNGDHLSRLRHDWALYPDHVVFLGSKPAIIGEDGCPTVGLDELADRNIPFVFSAAHGLYQSLSVTAAQQFQLRCYYNVVIRQGISEELKKLTDEQVSDLLNWDAEKYRRECGI